MALFQEGFESPTEANLQQELPSASCLLQLKLLSLSLVFLQANSDYLCKYASIFE
ncbi:hypothetical protein COO91_10896 (plasmid) [Nostoc flagelliforme CCNUN1]|uniref:Uncharacterized protein n=1 Tax=Nostoc flagelliforme CCNUN1 TaxID=2038116 RepID=A0A2K8TAD1_9NOSO|nr:hypothetical protein COO91_10896 [Nostoc flagelliforme CCNUN1]